MEGELNRMADLADERNDLIKKYDKVVDKYNKLAEGLRKSGVKIKDI